MSNPYPRTFSHIGISVPDLDAAVKFYTEVLGWYLIMEPTDVVEDDSAIGEMCTDVFGAGWERFRIAHLSTGDRVGVEDVTEALPVAAVRGRRHAEHVSVEVLDELPIGVRRAVVRFVDDSRHNIVAQIEEIVPERVDGEPLERGRSWQQTDLAFQPPDTQDVAGLRVEGCDLSDRAL